MYMILENPRRMTENEMRKEFADKWVYIVDCDFEIGVPMYLSFLSNELNVFGISEVVTNV